MKTERTKDRPFGPVKNYGAQPQQGAVSPEEAKSILEQRVTKEAYLKEIEEVYGK